MIYTMYEYHESNRLCTHNVRKSNIKVYFSEIQGDVYLLVKQKTYCTVPTHYIILLTGCYWKGVIVSHQFYYDTYSEILKINIRKERITDAGEIG